MGEEQETRLADDEETLVVGCGVEHLGVPAVQRGASDLRCSQLRELVTDGAIVVENECRFDGPDGEYLWRAVDILRIVGDEIVEHAQYCSGCWSPAEIARQSVEAPMVCW